MPLAHDVSGMVGWWMSGHVVKVVIGVCSGIEGVLT